MTVVLITGDDATLVAQSLRASVNELLGDGDRSLMVEEVAEEHYKGDGANEPDLAPLVNAAQTPPFLTARRIVIGRNLAMFTKGDQVKGLVEWFDNPLDSTDLVLVWEKGSSSTRLGSMPRTLKEALKSAGAQEINAAPSGKGRKGLLAEKLGEADVKLDPGARQLLASVVGDDVGRVEGILASLVSTFGPGAKLGANEVHPFLGEKSDVPPWELTDAIDSGDIGTALEKLGRMTRGGERHPLQVMATLQSHYQRALALDGASVRNEKDAAAILGMKGSTFPARKAMTLSKNLGGTGIAKAVHLLADADIDLRGGTAAPAEAVMEVLVARLARLSR